MSESINNQPLTIIQKTFSFKEIIEEEEKEINNVQNEVMEANNKES